MHRDDTLQEMTILSIDSKLFLNRFNINSFDFFTKLEINL